MNDENPVIPKALHSRIQERIDKCVVPSSIGRIPHKIAYAFSSFTADLWKSWTNIFSLYALHGILEDEDLECWHLFVRACQILTTPMLTEGDVNRGHKLLLDFCVKCESMYGHTKLHQTCTCIDCIKDFGPIYNFWLFSFERYIGLLGSYHTNQRSIELQLMCRFTTNAQICNLNISSELISEKELDFLAPKTLAGT